MSDSRRKSVSREDALEMILAETAKNPYTPRKMVRHAPQRPVQSSEENRVSDDVPRSTSVESSSQQPAARRSMSAEVQAGNKAVTMPQPNVSPEEMMRPLTEAQRAEEAKARAAKKIEEIKRARQMREQRDRIAETYPKSTEERKAHTRVLQTTGKTLNPIKSDNAHTGVYETGMMTEKLKNYSAVPELSREEEFEKELFDEEYDEEYDEYDDYEYDNYSDYAESGKMTLNDILEIAESSIIVIMFVIMFFTYIIRFIVVDGTSMSPTLEGSDKLIIRSIGYSPENGDVVVINNDGANLLSESGKIVKADGLEKMIVKRVIAKGGQTVDIDFESGAVTVDGKKLEEDYISEPTTRDEYAFEYPLTIPEGYVFVLGDNRNLSMDSRHPEIGLVPEDDILGKAVFRIYPFGKFGGID